MRKLIALPLLAAGVALTGTACQFGQQTVKAGEVESQISRKLGVAASCPGDLDSKVGAVLRCDTVGGAERRTVTVTVTSVEDEQVRFTMRVA
ncbi:DUF4333 domain-containing protein [Actinomadura hibisca]|uniref:DUF4333 domain-containing protein n=1 Tax=Actinomadura hibisca TaxID=68565 RepID=UPI0008347483|nr:DUF4333 domain-containing protein [Actinomadura hibisca]